MRVRPIFVLTLCLIAGLVALVAAQAYMQDDHGPVIMRSDTRVVEIDVTVRDSKGQPVEGLKASDFSVTDNGEARPFTIFSADHSGPGSGGPDSGAPSASSEIPKGLPQPRALPPNVFSNADAIALPPDGHSTIILLDGENGWLENFANARKGIVGLLTKLPADEKVAVYALLKGTGMAVLQDYTLDRAKVETVVTKFIPPGMQSARATMQRMPATEGVNLSAGLEKLGERPAQPTAGVDTYSSDPRAPIARYQDINRRQGSENVQLALGTLAQLLRNVPGRKSVFWVTQGFPPSEIQERQASWDKTTAALNDANIAVNTVDTNGSGGPERLNGSGATLTLQQIAAKTGGKAYIGRNDLDVAMASGISETRTSYALGFYLTKLDGKFHELKVKVDQPNLQLSYRQGYYAQIDAVAEPVKDGSGGKPTLQAALLNPAGVTAVKMRAILDIVPRKPRGVLHAQLTLDPELLTMKQTGSGYNGKVEELFLEQDADGREVGRYSDTKEFTIKTANKEKFNTEGAELSQEMPLAANAVNVSIVVRDTASGRTGSLVVPVDKLLNPSAPAEVKITADLKVAPGKPRETLNARLRLDPALLSLKQTSAGYLGKVEELFLELDAGGHEVGHYSEMKEFSVDRASKAKFDAQGPTLLQSFPLETRAVKVSIVVRDAASGKSGSVVIPIDKTAR